MFNASIDQREFLDLANRIVSNTKSKTRDVWKEIAKKFVLHATKYTPPHGKNPVGESFKEQRKIGIRAVTRDVHKLFIHLGPSAEQQVRLTKGNVRYWATKDGAVQGIPTDMLALSSPKAKLHDFHRKHWSGGRLRMPPREAKGGRVTYTNRMAAPTRNINAYAKWLARRVFIGKSGWSVAAAGLRQKLDASITKHGGAGVFAKSGERQWATYTIGNKVPHIQAKGRELKIIKRALWASTQNMKKQLLFTIRKNAMRKRL